MSSDLNGQTIARSVAFKPSVGGTYSISGSQGTAIPMEGASFGSIYVVSSATAVSFLCYGSQDAATADEIYSDGVAVTITIIANSPGWYELPSACLSVPYLHLSTNAGTATIRVYLKG